MIDLSLYVGKKVKATLRSGESREGLVGLNEDSSERYPYTFWGDTYTKDGRWFDDVESMRDIISVFCEDDPKPEPEPEPEPAKAIYIAWLDNQFICALPSRQDVKDYIKLKHPDVDPFDVIIVTEAYKSES